MLITARNQFDITKLKVQLSLVFNMKDLDLAKKILGMEIHKDQKAYRLWLAHSYNI